MLQSWQEQREDPITKIYGFPFVIFGKERNLIQPQNEDKDRQRMGQQKNLQTYANAWNKDQTQDQHGKERGSG